MLVEFGDALKQRVSQDLDVGAHAQQEHRQRRLAGHRIANVSPSQPPGGGSIHDFGAARHRPEWKTRSN